jgi:DNA-binding NarL/FixJ family response regulator
MTDNPVSVLIVDDQILFRQGLVGLLNSQPDFTVVGEAGSVEEATALNRRLRPHLILMDFSLPDGTGLDAIRAIMPAFPETKIVILTVHEEDERLFAAIRCGAKGYLLKNIRIEKLLAYLRGVTQGEVALTPDMVARVVDAFARGPQAPDDDSCSELTPREQEILAALAQDATNSEIARRFVISENTVKNHVHNILAKLGLRNRREAMQYARQRVL